MSEPGHTKRAHFSCEERDYCEEDCLDGYVCNECTNAADKPAWWPCPAAAAERPQGSQS